MLSRNSPIQRDQLEMLALEQLVPQEHLVRKMEAAIDFSFIYDLEGPINIGPSLFIYINMRKLQALFHARPVHYVPPLRL
jgi:hypothetical protein